MSDTDIIMSNVERIKLKKDIISRLKKEPWLSHEECVTDKEYLECVYDLLSHPKCQQMNLYLQHGNTTTLQHCIRVSYLSYKISRAYGLDYRSTARGALLHDLFLYDWHTHKAETGNRFHGFTHPKTAHQNAIKYFSLNKKEEDIILKHMWPMTIIPPKYVEGFIVMYVDKYCGFIETAQRTKQFLIRKLTIA